MIVESTISDDGRILTITITGRFDILGHACFSQSYNDKLESVSTIVIDMINVESIDSAALGLLFVLWKKAMENKAEVILSNCNPDVKKAVQVVRFDKLFKLV
ncbi:MAG: STAS domain-containing protein [Deltaproteobacteria bacterium]|nr:STAS domain-containing protein [Deltaproteobacteria bacterium]